MIYDNGPKFTLKYEYDGVVMTHEFSTPQLHEVIQQMEYFLKGSGFVFDGELDIVENHQYQIAQDFNLGTLDIDLDLNLGTLDDIEKMEAKSLLPEQHERCDVCKLRKDVMKEYTCFDKHCPKGKW
jgi:hypothetical protein